MDRNGFIVKKEGPRYFIAETFCGIRVTPWKRVPVIRLAELLAHHEAYQIAKMTVSMRLQLED